MRMDPTNRIPRRKQGTNKSIKYSFPQIEPIFWGPHQVLEDGKYKEPEGWKFNETLQPPFVVRFLHDDRIVDSDTADNTTGNGGGGSPGDRPWTLYDNACYVELSTCITNACNTPPSQEPNGFGGTTTRLQVYKGIGCADESVLPVFHYMHGYIHAPSTGGFPLFSLSDPLTLTYSSYFHPDGTAYSLCELVSNGMFVYQGSMGGAVAAGKAFLLVSITTWFWRRPTTSGPDPYEYTYTQWNNNRWSDDGQTLPNPDFVDQQYCYPGQPLYPRIP